MVAVGLVGGHCPVWAVSVSSLRPVGTLQLVSELQHWNWGLLCCRCYCRCYQCTKQLYPQEGRGRGVGGCAGGKDTTTRARVSVQGNPSSRHNTTTTSVCSVVSSWGREGHCFLRPVNHGGYIRVTLAGTGKDIVSYAQSTMAVTSRRRWLGQERTLFVSYAQSTMAVISGRRWDRMRAL